MQKKIIVQRKFKVQRLQGILYMGILGSRGNKQNVGPANPLCRSG